MRRGEREKEGEEREKEEKRERGGEGPTVYNIWLFMVMFSSS